MLGPFLCEKVFDGVWTEFEHFFHQKMDFAYKYLIVYLRFYEI